MDFSLINHAAVLVAAIAAFAFGALYYGLLFSRQWTAAARIDPAAMKPSPTPFVVSFICELVMAWVLAGIMFHVGQGQVSIRIGLISALFAWLGFMATTMAVNHRYEGFGWDLTLIDAGHWLGVALIMGVILGWWGP